MGYLFFYILN